MKRLLILLAVASLVMAVTVTPSASAAKPNKVEICHVNSANGVIEVGTVLITFGRVISVSPKAVSAHEAHGDSVDFEHLPADDRAEIEAFFGIALPNANCGIPS